MSQTWDIDTIVPATTSPAADVQKLIDGFNTLRSCFSGATEPAAADQVAYMFWADTANDLLKQRNAANSAWIVKGTLSAIYGGLLSLAGGNLTGGLNAAKSTIASATTPDIFAVTVGNTVDYTGTATATGFATAPQAGCQRTLVCSGAAVFTAGANMLIDGVASASNFTAAVGDKIYVLAVTTTQFRVTPLKYDGTAVVASDASLTTTDITTNNVTSSKHGLCPKAPADAAKFLNGGNPPAYTVPVGTLTAGTPATQSPFAANSKTTQAHGLGGIPAITFHYLQCLTAELGYSVGDRVFTSNIDQSNVYGYEVAADGTNIYIIANANIAVINKTTPAGYVAAASANWKVVAETYKLN